MHRRRPSFLRPSFLRSLTSLSLLTGIFALSSRDARAGWPPPPGATPDQLKDPANWPNDPSYGPHGADGKPDPNGSGGTWQYWSWMPKHDASHPVRATETATGMGIDVAWSFTVGDPRVKIAEIDTGILWDRKSLRKRFAINDKELQKAKPLDAAGAACGGTGDLAGLDCDGNGVFDMADYDVSPTHKVAGGKDLHDANANGLLDPGDLIVLFSDGVDDDHNGYVDDICGWDFFKDDNDPYDDTRDDHGTGEMSWSTEEGNDGEGGIGVCPMCRVVPLRVGDSFVSEVQANAKAVVYATDNGVNVVQQANGTVNQSTFMRAAFDYAYEKGTVVISTAADENSRHHNMPGTANHTIVVHAINKDADEARNAHTYLNYNPCSDYGGQAPLSVSGSACASEATGRSAGIAGLMVSLGLKKGLALSPEEIKQLMIESADIIDVPESYDAKNPDYDPGKYYLSHPYFSQRFGYGRQNAGKIMAAINDGRIPPEVDIQTPQWFEVIYPAQLSADVPIMGKISAKRAATYDGTIEWAPGIEPANDQWKQLGTIAQQPGTTVLGADGTPLGFIKVKEIGKIDNPPEDPLLKQAGVGDPNEFAITVRITVTAHYAGIGDVKGEMRKVFYVHDDPDLVAGFPKYLGASGEGSARIFDLDGDGKKDLIYPTADGTVLAMRVDGTPLAGWPFKTRRIDGLQPTKEDSPFVAHYVASDAKNAYTTGAIDPEIARESVLSAPAIGDIDGDGKPEVVFGTFSGTVYAVHADGTLVTGWPLRLPDVPSCPRGEAPKLPDKTPCMDEKHLTARGAFAAPSLADMDKNGTLDVVAPAFDGNVYVWDAKGQPLAGWPVMVHYDGPLDLDKTYARILTTAAVGDVTGDGIPEVAVGSNQKLGKSGGLGGFYLIDGLGNGAAGGKPYVDGWPQAVTSLKLLPLVGEGLVSAGMMADVDGDGTPEVIFHGTASQPVVYPLHPQQAGIPGGAIPNPVITLDPFFGRLYESPHALEGNNMIAVFSQPSIGDLDQDGHPDIVAMGASFFLALSMFSVDRHEYEQQVAFWSTAPQLCKDTQGTPVPGTKCAPMFPGSPTLIEDYTFFHNATIADLSGDDYPELILGTGGYYLRAVDACGTEAPGFPKFTGQWIIPSPALGDLDGDKKLEVVTGTRDGWLYAWHTNGREDGVVDWPTYHHDERNTGNFATPTGMGGKHASKPMDLNACVKATPGGPHDGTPSASGGGGCGCSVPGRAPIDPRTALAVAALFGAIGARRRKR